MTVEPRENGRGKGARLSLTQPCPAGCEEILTDEALEFVAGLVLAFGARRDELLERRRFRQAEDRKSVV